MIDKPKYTIVRYRTGHGTVNGVVRTEEPDFLLMGFTDRDSCIEWLRRHHAKRYLLDSEIQKIDPLQQKSSRYKRCRLWLSSFMEKLKDRPADGKTFFVFREEGEIDHCCFEDEYSLRLEMTSKGRILVLHHYSGWNGEYWDYRTDSTPEKFIYITEFCQSHAEDILSNKTQKI